MGRFRELKRIMDWFAMMMSMLLLPDWDSSLFTQLLNLLLSFTSQIFRLVEQILSFALHRLEFSILFSGLVACIAYICTDIEP